MDDRLMGDFSRRFLQERHGLMAFITGLIRDTQLAEDIFQEVWVKLAQANQDGEGIENQQAWCRTVAKNFVLQHWRRQGDMRVTFDSQLLKLADLVERAFDESASAISADQQQALNECVGVLPEKSRRLLALKYEHGLSISKIAGELELSSDAIVKALLRLRQALGLCIERKLRLQDFEQ